MDTTPKPGPSGLHSLVLKAAQSVPAPAPAQPGFRELAKLHARAADHYAERATASPVGSPLGADLLDLAQTHALVSIACAGVAPVARQRLIPCTGKDGAK